MIGKNCTFFYFLFSCVPPQLAAFTNAKHSCNIVHGLIIDIVCQGLFATRGNLACLQSHLPKLKSSLKLPIVSVHAMIRIEIVTVYSSTIY